MYQSREGVFSRASVIANAKTMEPAVWWSTYGRHLPLLSAFAPRILKQPCAASACERNWYVLQAISHHTATIGLLFSCPGPKAASCKLAEVQIWYAFALSMQGTCLHLPSRSVYGQIRSSQRSRLKHATADKLVYTHETLHLEQKMQDAGWAPDLERWASDTDSEGSEDGVDFQEGSRLNQANVLALCM